LSKTGEHLFVTTPTGIHRIHIATGALIKVIDANGLSYGALTLVPPPIASTALMTHHSLLVLDRKAVNRVTDGHRTTVVGSQSNPYGHRDGTSSAAEFD